MAIDWSRVARGVGTGYLGAKIATPEANDKMNANIIQQAGPLVDNLEVARNNKISIRKIKCKTVVVVYK